MAKIETTMTVSLEEFGQKAAEYALDEFEYKGMTIRQWADKIASDEYQPVKHGRWIFQGRYGNSCEGWRSIFIRNNEDGRHIYHCSECNFEVRVWSSNFLSWRMNEKYCPGCGARMDGVVE